jgi:nucleotide-sensitive chloride channel 1A
MPLESVTVVPQHEDYTPLSEHQAQTPATFFGSRPVLHCHAPGAKLAVRRSEYESNEILRQIEVSPRTEDEGILLDVDAWITSKYAYSTLQR